MLWPLVRLLSRPKTARAPKKRATVRQKKRASWVRASRACCAMNLQGGSDEVPVMRPRRLGGGFAGGCVRPGAAADFGDLRILDRQVRERAVERALFERRGRVGDVRLDGGKLDVGQLAVDVELLVRRADFDGGGGESNGA